MNFTETTRLLAEIGVLITVITNSFISLRNSRKIDVVHTLANSLADKRATAEREAGHATGIVEEKREQQSRTDIQQAAAAGPAAGPAAVATPPPSAPPCK